MSDNYDEEFLCTNQIKLLILFRCIVDINAAQNVIKCVASKFQHQKSSIFCIRLYQQKPAKQNLYQDNFSVPSFVGYTVLMPINPISNV